MLSEVSRYDLQSYLSWDEDINFYFGCNDCFYFASADAEDIKTLEDIELLQKCINVELVRDALETFHMKNLAEMSELWLSTIKEIC